MDLVGGGRSAGRLGALGIALMAFAWGTAGSAPAFDAAALRPLLRARGFSPAQVQAVLSVLEAASERGLPVPVLENRLREGLARGATPDAIRGVLAARTATLTAADEMARRGASQGIAGRDREANLTRLADAFSMGAAPADVETLLPAASRKGRDLEGVSRTAEVMGRLASRGTPSSDTRDVLQAALEAGWTRSQLDGLVDVFDRARVAGIPRDRARGLLVDGIRGGKDLSRLVESRAPAGGAAAASGAGRAKGSSSRGVSAGARGRGGASGSPGSHAPAARGQAGRTPAPRAPMPRTPGPRVPPPHH